MGEDRDEWATPVPLLVPPMRVTWASCEIRPCTRLVRPGQWDGVAVRYRSDPTSSSWEYAARLVAWARPRGNTGWPFCALVYMGRRYTSHNQKGVHSGVPAWRSNWLLYDGQLLERVESPREYPSAYWAESMSDAVAAFIAEMGPPPR